MAEAVDFTKVNKKGYKAWRILSATGPWCQLYSQREAALRGYRTAIIFPEQLLGLRQSLIYQVVVARSADEVTSKISGIRSFNPQGVNGECLDTLEKILEYERKNDVLKDITYLHLGRPGSDRTFYNRFLFSGAKDALAYQAREQARYISQIG